jgi:indole-3-glycerol phosphate synthase
MTAVGYLDRKRAELDRRGSRRDELDALRARACLLPPPPDFAAALHAGSTVSLIAEFKRRSPSAGELTGEAPGDAARLYANAGARALSVLTDPDFGALDGDLETAARAVPLPVLRKDFLVDPAEVATARLAGAAASLVIVALLSDAELRALIQEAERVGIRVLVEVRDEAEASRALDAGARILGINNRDLRTLATDLATTERVASGLPPGVTVVAESGLATAGDVCRMRDAGAAAVLVGESLLRLPPATRRARVLELAGVPRR